METSLFIYLFIYFCFQVGGVGITLTSADRVVICKSVFSVPWSTLLSANQFSEQAQQKYSLSTPKNTWRSRQSREVARTRACFVSFQLLCWLQKYSLLLRFLRAWGAWVGSFIAWTEIHTVCHRDRCSEAWGFFLCSLKKFTLPPAVGHCS